MTWRDRYHWTRHPRHANWDIVDPDDDDDEYGTWRIVDRDDDGWSITRADVEGDMLAEQDARYDRDWYDDLPAIRDELPPGYSR